MSLLLYCSHLTAALPALTPGVTVALCRTPAGGLEFHIPATPSVVDRVLSAIREGALILNGPADPLWDEIERMIMADRDRLLAEAAALSAALHRMDRAG